MVFLANRKPGGGRPQADAFTTDSSLSGENGLVTTWVLAGRSAGLGRCFPEVTTTGKVGQRVRIIQARSMP